MILKFFMLGVRHRTGVIIVLFLITLLAAAGMYRLRIDTGLDSLIPASDPARLVYQQVMGEFGTDNKTIIYIKDKDLWTPEKLAVLDKTRSVKRGS